MLTQPCLPKPVQSSEHDNEPCILLVEDDHDMRAYLADLLRGAGYEVVECPDAFHLLDFYVTNSIGRDTTKRVRVVISDVRMPGIDGLELLDARTRTHPGLPTILITAFGDEQTHRRATELGVAAFLDKPFESADLLQTLADVLRDHPPVGDGDYGLEGT